MISVQDEVAVLVAMCETGFKPDEPVWISTNGVLAYLQVGRTQLYRLAHQYGWRKRHKPGRGFGRVYWHAGDIVAIPTAAERKAMGYAQREARKRATAAEPEV